MSQDASGQAGLDGGQRAGSYVGSLPFADDGEAGGVASVSPLIIEISDNDYRSFCFPCHALEEAGHCNAGF